MLSGTVPKMNFHAGFHTHFGEKVLHFGLLQGIALRGAIAQGYGAAAPGYISCSPCCCCAGPSLAATACAVPCSTLRTHFGPREGGRRTRTRRRSFIRDQKHASVCRRRSKSRQGFIYNWKFLREILVAPRSRRALCGRIGPIRSRAGIATAAKRG